MNIELTNRIKQYLELETNYAIIINGNYGIGKTYYIKNNLFPEIKTIRVPNSDKKETFIPVSISLFGAKSIEDINKQILAELYPMLKSNATKLATNLGKSIIKRFIDEPDKLLNDITFSSDNLIDYNKIVLCIDDIDRKSDELSLKEVFGFINNLVENKGTKILLVANENKLREEIDNDDSYYSVLREKVIGISVTFSANTNKIYDEIIKTKYKENNKDYFNFLTKNKDSILFRIKQNKQNLRNLIFFLEHFKIIFNKLNNFLESNKEFDKIKEIVKKEILDFTLPIAIEYKTGRLNSTDSEEIRSKYKTNFIDIASLIKKSETRKEENTYSDIYAEKYITQTLDKTMYFDSIFQYILGNSSFKFSKLEEEIIDIYNPSNKQISEKEKILKNLDYHKCIDLPYSQYKQQISTMLSYVDKGDFSLEMYPSIFYSSIRFNNPLNYNIKKLIRRFKKGINKGKPNYEYMPILKQRFLINITEEKEYYSELTEIAEFCVQINENIYKEKESSKIEHLLEYLKNGETQTFVSQINSYIIGEFWCEPIFVSIKLEYFWNIIRKLKNSQIIEFAFGLERRYKKNICNKLFPEKEFLIKLKNKIDTFIKSKYRTKFEVIAYQKLKEKVELSILNFPKK